jgi:hypothetical protein
VKEDEMRVTEFKRKYIRCFDDKFWNFAHFFDDMSDVWNNATGEQLVRILSVYGWVNYETILLNFCSWYIVTVADCIPSMDFRTNFFYRFVINVSKTLIGFSNGFVSYDELVLMKEKVKNNKFHCDAYFGMIQTILYHITANKIIDAVLTCFRKDVIQIVQMKRAISYGGVQFMLGDQLRLALGNVFLERGHCDG